MAVILPSHLPAEISLDGTLCRCGEKIDGTTVLAALLDLAAKAVSNLKGLASRGAAVARLRGTGPGMSFSRMIDVLEADYPVKLVYPFEGNARVGGAVWPRHLAPRHAENAIMKLRWEAGANDLPMHSHEGSDRCIIVLQGRGFFHVTDQPVPEFTGSQVRTVAARQNDVFVFTSGVVHTFSTFNSPMVLLSCHLPHVMLDDPRQFTLPSVRWTAAQHLGSDHHEAIELDGWSMLTGRS